MRLFTPFSSLRRTCMGDAAIHRRGGICDIFMDCFVATLLAMTMVSSQAFGANPEDATSAFDIMQDQHRYDGERSSPFDVTEGNEEVEENAKQSSYKLEPSKELNQEKSDGSYHKIAKLVAINKITARSQEMQISVGQSAYFGNIEIKVEKCWYNEDPYKPSYRVLIKVIENKIDEDPKNIFHGWLISSNIPVSILQDPTYEIIALNCMDHHAK